MIPLLLWLGCGGCCAVLGAPLDTLPRTPNQPPFITAVVPAKGHPWAKYPRRWVWLEAKVGDRTVCLYPPIRLRNDSTPPRGGWRYAARPRPPRVPPHA